MNTPKRRLNKLGEFIVVRRLMIVPFWGGALLTLHLSRVICLLCRCWSSRGCVLRRPYYLTFITNSRQMIAVTSLSLQFYGEWVSVVTAFGVSWEFSGKALIFFSFSFFYPFVCVSDEVL